jgi:tetratricopeptide (TPR) repeat protein
MTGEQWAFVRRLLDEALDNPQERPALLAKLRHEDPEICEELERLLADVEREDQLVDEPDPAIAGLSGQTVGPYTIVREIGRGGAGTVVLAAREEAGVRVEAAIKFLRRDFLRGAPRRTFQRELRLLARLDHPNIARLLDWGAIPGGLFYLAIEYVDGQTITQFCTHNRSGLADRLALFQQVCEAVAHAHRSLVVHRDLKPSNILVKAGSKVKLLDFGIAAELDSADEPTTLLQRALTPAYASPEQIEGHAVTVATDVYSLGLVLYELLAGCLPYSKDADRFWTTLREAPAPPSKLATLAEVSAREIAGDLDGIVLKAIHKEPGRRYLSVEQFAADIRRFREGRPVLARRASRLYIAGRFLQRNRLNVAAASLAIMALTASAGVAVWKWRAANRNLVEAQRDYRELRSFAQAVIANVDARTVASPTEEQRRMSETVARYLDQLSRGRQDDEELQLQIAAAYVQLGVAQGGDTYPNQGDSNTALENFQKSYEICLKQWRAKTSRNSGVRLLVACQHIAPLLADPAPAAAFLSAGIDTTRVLRARFPKDKEVLTTFSNAYGVLAQRLRTAGDLPSAIEDFRKAIETAKSAVALQPDDAGALTLAEAYTGELGATLRLEGRPIDALADQMEARQIALRALAIQPANHTRRQAAFKLLKRCETLRDLKRYPEALQDARDALAELRAIAGQDSANDQAKTDLSLAYFRMGDVEFSQGRISDGLGSHREALRLRQDQYLRHSSNPQATRNYLRSLTRFAQVQLVAREDRRAEANFDTAISLGERLRRQAPSDAYAAADLAEAYRGMSACALRGGRRPEATEFLRQSVLIFRDVRQHAPFDVEIAAAAEEAERALAELGPGS